MSEKHYMLAAALTFASAFAISSAARAADVVQPEPAPAPAVVQGFGWTGFYLGVGGGFGAVIHDLSSTLAGFGSADFNGIGDEGVFGDATVGYDYMFPNRMLIGAFADGRFGNIGPTLDALGYKITARGDYGFDVGGRVGYLVTPTSLAYVLGGYSWQHFKIDTGSIGYNYDWNSGGFFAGVGLETALRGNWSLKTEYRYAQYQSHDFLPGGLLSDEPSSHTFHVGLNYRFNGHAMPASFTAPTHTWTGLYVGGSFGAGALVHDLKTPPALGSVDFNGVGAEGVLGGVTIGYDYEFANGFVAGVLADATLSSIAADGHLTITGLGSGSVKAKADHGFDVLGRLGYKVDGSTLVYALGGYSWQHFKADLDAGGLGSYGYDWNANGFTVGGGLETAINKRATLGIEYRYSQYESEDFNTNGYLKDEPYSHTVRLNLNYRLF